MEYLKPYNTALEAWSPLAEGRSSIFKNKSLVSIGEKYGKTSAQIALKFLIQNDVIIIPKTTHKERMVENINLFDFTLTDDDIREIRLLDTGRNVTGWPKVITLCGSTRFKEQFIETQKRLTLEGCIVISVGLFGHSGDEEVWNPGTKEMLDDMHKRKIDMADEIFVINVGGYIGESTRSEIAYAEKTGKKVNYLEPIV